MAPSRPSEMEIEFVAWQRVLHGSSGCLLAEVFRQRFDAIWHHVRGGSLVQGVSSHGDVLVALRDSGSARLRPRAFGRLLYFFAFPVFSC